MSDDLKDLRVESKLSMNDYETVFVPFIQKNQQPTSVLTNLIWLLVFTCLYSILFSLILPTQSIVDSFIYKYQIIFHVASIVVFLEAYAIVIQFVATKRNKKSLGTLALGPRCYLINDDGIEIQGNGFSCFYSWHLVRGVELVNGLIIVSLDSSEYLAISTTEKDQAAAITSRINSKCPLSD